jgi:nucleotide-binding universal stress UspA family protein
MKPQPFKLRKLLVATDFSEHAAAALGRAVWLAEQTGAEITVAHVIADAASAVEGTSFEGHWRVPPADISKAERKLRRQARERLAKWIDPVLLPRKRCGVVFPAGVPFVEIIRTVQRDKFDLVLAGTRGLSGLKRLFVGSTAERLVRKCPCPVWIEKAEHQWPLRSILVPVDFSDASAKGLGWAALLADLCGCPLDVLHVIAPPDEEGLPEDTSELDTRVQRRRVRQAASGRLAAFVSAHVPAGTEVQERLALGTPWKMIALAARRTDAGLIVLGSVGRTGIPGFLIGNTAEKVLRLSGRSILTVKPDGFVSPIRPTP